MPLYISILDTVKDLVNEVLPFIRDIVPIFLKSELSKFNLWTRTAVSSRKEKTTKGDSFRLNFIAHTGGLIRCPETKEDKCRCMLSGLLGLGDQVRVAHLLPAVSTISILTQLGFKEIDTDSVRNGLLLCKGFELAFDQLQASFILGPCQGLREGFIFKMWNDCCRNQETFPGSGHLIGSYEGQPLILNGHEPFSRVLSYQAYQAFMHNSIAPTLEPVAFGTPTPPETDVTRLRSQLKLYKSAVAADIENEVYGGSGGSSIDADSSIAGDPADEESEPQMKMGPG